MKKTADPYSLALGDNRRALLRGMKDGIPIGLGYFVVAVALGFSARKAGFTAGQGFVTSLLCITSTGEYAGISLIAAGASYIELLLMTLIVNARYILMSCAVSQRVRPGLSMAHRLLMPFGLTDEIFAVTIARPGYMDPNHSYGAVIVAATLWAAGTAVGCLVGDIMPPRLTSAFSVALFGMFLAVIIPPARENKVIAGLVAISFALSYAAARLPLLAGISGGTRTIILTVALSAAVALLFPKAPDEEAQP